MNTKWKVIIAKRYLVVPVSEAILFGRICRIKKTRFWTVPVKSRNHLHWKSGYLIVGEVFWESNLENQNNVDSSSLAVNHQKQKDARKVQSYDWPNQADSQISCLSELSKQKHLCNSVALRVWVAREPTCSRFHSVRKEAWKLEKDVFANLKLLKIHNFLVPIFISDKIIGKHTICTIS